MAQYTSLVPGQHWFLVAFMVVMTPYVLGMTRRTVAGAYPAAVDTKIHLRPTIFNVGSNRIMLQWEARDERKRQRWSVPTTHESSREHSGLTTLENQGGMSETGNV
jgi:hypothetical protein